MDVIKALRDLHEEKRRLDLTIAALEARLGKASRARARRGRKSMSPQERQEVSRRMSKYWEARRAAAVEAGAIRADALPADPTQQEPRLEPKTLAAASGSSLSA